MHEVIGNDDHVVALTTVRAEREGRTPGDTTVRVFHIRDRKATEVWTYPADQYTSDEFWSWRHARHPARGATPITRSGAATTATMPTEVADQSGGSARVLLELLGHSV